MSDPHEKDDQAPGPTEYDRGTLIAAGLIFVGFALLLYFLPVIMTECAKLYGGAAQTLDGVV